MKKLPEHLAWNLSQVLGTNCRNAAITSTPVIPPLMQSPQRELGAPELGARKEEGLGLFQVT